MVTAPRYEDFTKSLREFVAKGSGLDFDLVTPGNDNHPRPVKPYATLLLITDRRMAYPARLEDEAAEMTSSASYRRATFSLQFYRTGALDYARDFCVWCESEIGLTTAEDLNFQVLQVPPLSFDRLDEIVGDGFEERAIINGGTFMIDYVQETMQATGFIDRIDGTLSYGSMSETISHTP